MTAVSMGVNSTVALVLIVSGIGKLLDPASTRVAALQFGLGSKIARLSGVGLPVLELAIATAILVPMTAQVGSFLALGLFVVFFLIAVSSFARGRTQPCNCFGRFSRSRQTTQTLARNVILLALALLLVLSWTDPADFDGETHVPLLEAVLFEVALVAAVIGWQLLSTRQSTTAALVDAASSNEVDDIGIVSTELSTYTQADRGSSVMFRAATRRTVLRSFLGLAAVAVVDGSLQLPLGALVDSSGGDARNTRHDASCHGFGSYQASTGVYDAAGHNHPSWSGATLMDLLANPTLSHVKTTIGWYCPCVNPPIYYMSEQECEAVAPCQPGLGGCDVKCGGNPNCLTATIKVNITGKITVSTLRWVPSVAISSRCRSAIAAFNSAVDAHEAHHQADAAAILKQAANDPPGQITACGSSATQAQRSLAKAARKYAKDREQYYLDLYSKSIEAFHSSVEGSAIFLDCTSCP